MLTRTSRSFDLSSVLTALVIFISAPALAFEYDFGSQEVSVAALDLEFPFVPDSEMTQGSLCTKKDPDYGYLRYGEKIPYCNRNVEYHTKTEIYRMYGVADKCRKQYTVDHFIPLALGGSNHVDNLWPEHKSIKNLRHSLEIELYKKMDQGKITQKEAIRIIRHAKLNPPVENPDDFDICM